MSHPFRWLRSRTGNSRRLNGNDAPEMPCLQPRPFRALTLPLPHSSESAMLSQKQITPSQPQSPFFTRLPPEIRMLIYEELFGCRILHLEFEYGRPDLKGTQHANLDYAHKDASKPKGWRWWHCVCHRDSRAHFFADRCRLGAGITCNGVKEKSGCKLDITILSTCRQA